MAIPIVLSDLGLGDEPVRISCWLAGVGAAVERDERVVELVMRGITFDVSAPAAGVLTRVEKQTGCPVTPEDILGWIDV